MTIAWRTMLVLAGALAIAATASAQTAPDGNAHPQTQAISDSTPGERNPFGEPSASSLDTDAKRAFADAVDLEPLRDLAVFHNGRVKILDTLARETVRDIMDRRDFVDFKILDDGKADKQHYDPLFTFIDLVIDREYYFDKPLIHVEYLPLREALLTQMYSDKEEREWWKRLGRLKPGELLAAMQQIGQSLPMDNPTQRAVSQMSESFSLYRDSWHNLLVIAPKGEELAWHHLSEQPAGSSLDSAAAALGRAWRAGDAPKANEAIRMLAAELPKINAENYPAGRRSLEAT
jgi:hypothetical protein